MLAPLVIVHVVRLLWGHSADPAQALQQVDDLAGPGVLPARAPLSS